MRSVLRALGYEKVLKEFDAEGGRRVTKGNPEESTGKKKQMI